MAREQRWLVVVEDGRHATIGRAFDPSPEELDAAGAALDSEGLAGWLVVSDGDYWGEEPVDLMLVRRLTQRDGSWEAASAAWQEARRRVTRDV